MNDEQLEQQVRLTARVTADQVGSWNLGAGEDALFRAIVGTGPAASPTQASRRLPARVRGFATSPLRVGLVAAGAVAAVAVTFVLTSGGAGTGTSSFADAAVRVAEANSRLLVTVPGWSVTSANQFEPDQGEIQFSDGQHELTMTWYAAKWYGHYYRDREPDGRFILATGVSFPELGPSRTVRYVHDDYATMFEPEGETFVEVRADLPAAEYESVVGSLEAVDVATWLGAMPASVVQPTDRPQIVDAIVADMPLPPGIDLDPVRDDAGVLDRYQLIAKTTSVVACGWLDLWADAVKNGDAPTAVEATTAMQSSHEWDALHEIEDQGGYSQVVWEMAKRMERGDRAGLLGPAGTESYPDGRVYETGPGYATAFGCDSAYRRLIQGPS